MLFQLGKPVQLAQQEFDEFWPLVDVVWTTIGGNTTQRKGTVQVQHCECRLRKSKKTGTNVARKEGRVVKPRMTTITSGSEPATVLLERKDDFVHIHIHRRSFPSLVFIYSLFTCNLAMAKWGNCSGSPSLCRVPSLRQLIYRAEFFSLPLSRRVALSLLPHQVLYRAEFVSSSS